ncbi:MAG TPA: hypothetical protein VFM41_14580 [Gaiella sp.]|nr:hypothetical protein [Gaiella sp.]
MRNRLPRTVLVVLAVAALAGAAIAANVFLLGYADSRPDPVGKLSPRATITQPAIPGLPSSTTAEDDHEHGNEHGHDTTVEEPDD